MDISICIFDYKMYTFSNNKNHNFRSSKTQQSDILRFWKSNNSKFWYFAQKHISILPQVLNRGSTSRSPVHTHSTTGPRWFTNTSLQKVTCFRFGKRDRDYVKVKPSRADQDHRRRVENMTSHPTRDPPMSRAPPQTSSPPPLHKHTALPYFY